MIVAIVGLGSMGKRRARLLKKIKKDITIYGIDNEENRINKAIEYNIDRSFTSLEDLFSKEKVDCIFVCTPPITHFDIIDKCLDNDIHIFTEINLVSNGYKNLIEKAASKGKKLFLSSTMLYRREIKWIEKKIKGEKINYIYHVGQYLPDWHPWESYKDFFVSNIKTNACREIFAIELPWIVRTMGNIKKIDIVSDKISNLDINYDDNYILNLVHENGTKGVLFVDIVTREACRSMEIFSEDVHIKWDGTPNSLRYYNIDNKKMESVNCYDKINKDDSYSDSIIEDAYHDEIVEFFKVINNETQASYSFEEDFNILSMLDEMGV